jgi:hypothetical protein
VHPAIRRSFERDWWDLYLESKIHVEVSSILSTVFLKKTKSHIHDSLHILSMTFRYVQVA